MNRYRVEHLKCEVLTPAQIKQLDQLHLKRGLMWPRFMEKREENASSDVFLCWDGDIIIGWSHVFADYGVNNYHTFVNESYRRQGVGTLLFQAANKIFPTVIVSKWNTASTGFYNSLQH